MYKTGYKYSFDKSSKKFICPKCHKKSFVKYVDNENGIYLSGNFGICDRDQKCGYFLKPEKDINSIKIEPVKYFEPKPTFLPLKYVDQFYNSEDGRNNFIIFLKTIFSEKEVIKIVNDYLISSCFYWNEGATIFWQIDQMENVRTGQVMLYNPITGKRIREPKKRVDWVHSILKKKGKIKDFVLSQCLFGLHLIKDYPEKNMIGIVESPKSACVMSVIFPKYIWMATCGLSNIKPKLFKPLQKKKIVLYPDLGCFDLWNTAADLLKKNGFNVEVSDLLEIKCSASTQGNDIADYFIDQKLMNNNN